MVVDAAAACSVVGTRSVCEVAASVVLSSSHPCFFGPFASLMPSAQHPCLLAAQPPSVVVVIISTGHPSWSLPSASVFPSKQQPNKLLWHNAFGQALFFLPLAGDTSSGQQPN